MFKGFRHAAHRQAFGHYAHYGWHRRPKYNVPVNISDWGTFYEVSVYATGFDKADIRISVSGKDLIIKGKREVDESQVPEFIRQEFPVRHFERSVTLGEGIDVAGITATQENQVLLVRIPKPESDHSTDRDIEIQ